MENQPVSADRHGAQDALRLISDTRAELADRILTPWWYHPGLGLVMAGLVINPALGRPSRYVVLVLCLVGVALLAQAYARVTGLGFSAEYTRLAIGELAALLAVALAAIFTVMAAPVLLVALPAAVVVFAATIVLGRRADRTIRRKLRQRVDRP